MGRRPHRGLRLSRFVNHKSHAIRVPKLSTAPQKRCNSNDTISKFEMFAQELHATFLGNHNTRPHRTPSRGHLNTGDAQAPEVPASPAATTARSTGALHPIWGAAPDMGRCTRYGALHPNWGTAPEQKRCIAYGSGAAPQHTRTNAELAKRTTPPPQPARAATRPRPNRTTTTQQGPHTPPCAAGHG